MFSTRLAVYNYMQSLPIMISSRYPTTASNSASEGEELKAKKDCTAKIYISTTAEIKVKIKKR